MDSVTSTPNTIGAPEQQNPNFGAPPRPEVSPKLQQPEQPLQGPEKGELPQSSPSEPVDLAALQQATQDAQAVAQPVMQSQAATVLDDEQMLVASDDDVIEKEWVNKAKQIVAQTRDDPHAQEREVSKLQADYMQKRFGKEIKLVDI